MDNFDDFASKSGLTESQKSSVMKYIIELLTDNLKSMKEEYNAEVDQAINGMMAGFKADKKDLT